jgi:hypothetical protein
MSTVALMWLVPDRRIREDENENAEKAGEGERRRGKEKGRMEKSSGKSFCSWLV